jgi:hypothetical protein
MATEDSFDRVYKATNRFLSLPQLQLGMAIVIGLLALIVTLGAILQPMPALTRVTILVVAIFLWLFTAVSFNWWRHWRVVYTWKGDQEELQRKSERVDAYFKKVDAGELPEEPMPPEIRQDLRDMLQAWRRELLRQEWRD